ncbi:hypothetical protein [Luteimonas huabeiensis]|uniref:hypothetical protein n=1 Tax=Luteimonas huabeiensis TaxID=1244513 RepID=UPI00126804DB|nr:hypothetical protein [Luteimonas huabeiensis]
MSPEDFKKKYPTVSLEEVNDVDYVEDDNGDEVEVHSTYYIVKKLPVFDELALRIHPSEFERLDQIVEGKPELFKGVLGVKFDKTAEVVLSRVVGPSLFVPTPMRSSGEPIRVSTFYRGKAVSVHIYAQSTIDADIAFLGPRIVGGPIQYRSFFAVVTGIQKTGKLEQDVMAVLRSVLFDIEFTYGLALEAANLDRLKRRTMNARRRAPALPTDEINLVVKPYTPELIEYYHTAARVDYVPFKFICYFHIVEYFMDKSAHRVVSRRLRQILMRPDFHVNHQEHLNEAIKIFKAETEKNLTDKIKINRVLAEYVRRDEIRAFLDGLGLLEHFSKDHTLNGPRPLKVSALNFDSDQSFVESLGKRVYALRCSIVHSNPDFDESKAVPFHASQQNLDFLRTENDLMREIAHKVIVNSIAE